MVVPVPSLDKGGGFCGGLATHPGKNKACNRNNTAENTSTTARRRRERAGLNGHDLADEGLG
jgi:hypothetical protein